MSRLAKLRLRAVMVTVCVAGSQKGRDQLAPRLVPVHHLGDKGVRGLASVEHHARLIRSEQAACRADNACHRAVDGTGAENLNRAALEAVQSRLRRLIPDGHVGGKDFLKAVAVKVHHEQLRIALIEDRLLHLLARPVEGIDADVAHAALSAAPADHCLRHAVLVDVAEHDLCPPGKPRWKTNPCSSTRRPFSR